MRRILLIVVIFISGVYFLIKSNEESDIPVHQERELTGEEIWEDQLNKKKERRKNGYSKMDQPDLYQKFHAEIRTREGAESPDYPINYKIEALKKLRAEGHSMRLSDNGVIEFAPRGPANVPGRTRGLLVLPGDPNKNTWLAGAAGGGIWKTTNAGQSWRFLTPEFPTMAVSTLAMSEVDDNIIYAGTGEYIASSGTAIDGQGIFKSTDGGETWVQLPSTANSLNFLNITRIIVDPGNPDLVLASSAPNNWRTGPDEFLSTIMRSEDGGQNWTKVMEVTLQDIQNQDATGAIEQLIATPGDFNTLYASMHGYGPWKSIDAGLTWTPANNGMSAYGRVELAISPVKPDRLFASAEGSLSGTSSDSDLYISDNGGERWSFLATQINDVPVDFLGGQGWYDNAIACDPYNMDIVYAGGVSLFRFQISDTQRNSYSIVMENLEFLQLVNFGAEYQGGTLEANEFAGEEDIEIRFGPGRSQRAHRYLVPENATSGVPPEEYYYQDYVEVPFEVWDITNNRQLMVGFRDQDRNGEYNLKQLNTAETTPPTQQSREYIYIADIDYNSSTPDPLMSETGGHEYRNKFFFWPVLAEGQSWDPENLPESSLFILYNGKEPAGVTTLTVADVYAEYDGKNRFSDFGDVHPDQHTMIMIPANEQQGTYKILLSNDGGVFYSNTSTTPGIQEGDWAFAGHGYITTQFYGAQKKPGGESFLGGAQDNGTWHSPTSGTATESTDYIFAIGGDGFEVLWHAIDPNKMIGGSQFNNFRRSLNQGSTWQNATSGISGNSPFISKLASSDDLPEVIYTVSSDGVFRSDNFGGSWQLTLINENWVADVSSTFLDVEVSNANANIIWAGSGMTSNRNLHYSTDGGKTFQMAENFADNLGTISRLGSHPHEDSTAFALFSFAKGPKVLRTTDLGQTWEDISGFGINETSSNGFPDVAIYCIYVRPDNPDIIWVGSELGIIESLDNGQSWHLLDDFLNASVWQFQGRDNFITIATHGRGIWTAEVGEEQGTTERPTIDAIARMPNGKIIAAISYPEEPDSTAIFLNNHYVGTLTSPNGLRDTVVISGFSTNSIELNVLAYRGSAPVSNMAKTQLAELRTPVTSFYTTFSQTSPNITRNSYFRQTVNSSSENLVLNSPHDYPNNADLIFSVSSPLIVSEENPVISYEDIAIIQPEEDYVVVEGTVDGLNWIPLAPAYDASLNERWLEVYNSDEGPESDDFVQHELDLTQTFDPNDTIFVRFRLHSDEEITAWGWAVDNIFVQREVVSVQKESVQTFTIHPNPSFDELKIRFKDNGSRNVSIVDITGRIWYSGISAGKDQTLNVRDFNSGIYFLVIEEGSTKKVKKFIVKH